MLVDKLRDLLKLDRHRWNRTRYLMRDVWRKYEIQHPDAIAGNPWLESKRIAGEQTWE